MGLVTNLSIAGARFAKLEQHLIIAYFIASFDVQLSDKDGKAMPMEPRVGFNGYSLHKPRKPMYLKLTTRES